MEGRKLFLEGVFILLVVWRMCCALLPVALGPMGNPHGGQCCWQDATIVKVSLEALQADAACCGNRNAGQLLYLC